VSGPDTEKLFEVLREADAHLLTALGNLNFGMAAVESEDFRNPQVKNLKDAEAFFVKASDLLTQSIQSVQQIGALQSAPERLRIEIGYTSKDIRALQQSINDMASSLAIGTYPSIESCDLSATILRDVYTTMRRNARIVRS
jgi:hypothetical protein